MSNPTNFKKMILDWFETDRDFESGKKLYIQYGTNLSFKNVLNRVGNTSSNLKSLYYELAKLANISEAAYKAKLAVPIIPAAAVQQTEPEDINTIPIEKLVAEFIVLDLSKLDYEKMKVLIKALEIKPVSNKKADITAALFQMQSERKIAAVPIEIRRSVKLRDEFPFLRTKECPSVLKELVADMLTDYDNFVANHEKLLDMQDPQVIAQLSQDIVEDYLDNRAIWAELNHYKETGQLLGEHPAFEWLKRRDEIRALNTPELIKLRDTLNNNIPRTKKLLTDEPDHKDTAKRSERLEWFEKELTEVKSVLGLNA
ncbi:MAG: hypothetical protein ACOYN5_04525 [Bacteroidales bacterium]